MKFHIFTSCDLCASRQMKSPCSSESYLTVIMYSVFFIIYLQAKANTMVLDKKLFFNGLHNFENISLLRNNLNVLKFKGNH